MANKHKRLSKVDIDRLWGEDTPYSQVNLIEQARVLGDGISRVFLVVEAEINPFTFEYVLAHRQAFADDPMIQQLLDHAEYRGFIEGYVASAGEEELRDKRSFEIALAYKEIALKNILKMHDLVIADFGLKRSKHQGIKVKDPVSDDTDTKYIWNEASGQVLPVDDKIWGSESTVHSPAGNARGKFRYFVVFVLSSGQTLGRADIKWSAIQMKAVAQKLHVEIEEAEAGNGYIMFTVLIGPDTAPADFIEGCIKESNKKKKIFKKEYYVTNVSRPTGNEIMSFLAKLA